MTFAVIKTGGKQYKVTQGDIFEVEKLDIKEGDVTFDEVLLLADGDKVTLGTPVVKGASVTAKVLSEAKGEKKMVFRYHNKTRYRKKKGHRQIYTKIEITKITA